MDHIFKAMIIFYSIICLLLVSNISGESDSSNSENSEENRDDKKRSAASDYWRNHRYVNYVYPYAKQREPKASNDHYFTEANNNEPYETVPSTIQITALPAGGFGGGGFGGGAGGGGMGMFPGAFGGGYPESFHGNGWNQHQQHQKFPVFVINKSKSDHSKWFIPLLLLLGAPLLCGLIFIPIVLQSIFFFFTIFRNLGFLLPLIPGIAGNNGNPIIPATG